MDQSEVLRFEQQKQITKLSQAIREGARQTLPIRTIYLTKGYACLLGAAAIGSGYSCDEHTGGHLPIYDHLKKTFGVSTEFLVSAETMWNFSGMTREAIADVLEAEGY